MLTVTNTVLRGHIRPIQTHQTTFPILTEVAPV